MSLVLSDFEDMSLKLMNKTHKASGPISMLYIERDIVLFVKTGNFCLQQPSLFGNLF